MSDLPTARNPRLRLVLPLVVAFAFFLEQLDATIIATAIPDMAESLRETPLRLNLALTSYILSLAVFIPVSGFIADRFGMRRTFAAAILIFTVGSAACGAAPDFAFLVMARVVQGFGGAMMTPVGRLILLRSFPRSELASAIAYMTIPAVVGPTLGPLVGGIITTYASWRWIFYVNLPVGLVGVAMAWRLVPELGTPPRERFDWPGFALCAAGMALLEFGIENLGHPVLPLGGVLGLFVAAGVIVAVYLRYARGHSNAVLDPGLLRIRTFRISVAAGGLCRIGVNAVPFMLPLMFQVGFGLSPVVSGSLTFVSSLGAMVIRAVTVRLLRALGFDRLLTFNAVACAMSVASFSLVGPATPHWMILGMVALFGILRNTQFSTLQTMTYADIPAVSFSRATSLGGVLQQLTMGFGVSISAALLGLLAGPVATVSVPQFHAVFLAMALVTLASTPGFRELRPGDGAQVSNHHRRPKPLS